MMLSVLSREVEMDPLLSQRVLFLTAAAVQRVEQVEAARGRHVLHVVGRGAVVEEGEATQFVVHVALAFYVYK